ncbi:D-alanyl-D-alanine carboxypeptidase/D-alanyl-D-alanine endopeptidase [Aphanothece sacrum]|uniref:D-alanyl-D-alanine carboxypeptidase n=1 Tax=Aphanothece sacrum FPU1 TaxID=1920663 RepID=A0A401IHE1_APHSA|nr:D-alanyl-D-alanine carboxypeptidase/D-alanyl-D-alanine-endopeptidase [Aphanothece sacrum]GBF80703.1 D-alanyl-D-alanine carboxypeptidase [Aphanothece sacrum FPU1]GBF83197.1 D-alanyl-D-alanine carboxypeptidase [Aphanothece sacrum FPU3]
MNNCFYSPKLTVTLGLFLLTFLEQFTPNLLAIEALKHSYLISQSEEKSSICPADLSQEIERIIKEEKYRRSRWGILIQTLDSGSTLYALDEQKYFIPASNVKLLTTAAVLLKYGSQFRINTPIYITGNYPHLQTLRIVGKGDPSLTTQQLQTLAKWLKIRGIKQIDQLIVTDGDFKESPINLTWEWEDIQFYYATAINHLILNENAVTLKLIPQNVGEPLKLEWSDSLAGQQWQINNQTLTAPKDTAYSITIERDFAQPILTLKGELASNTEPDTFGLAVVNPTTYFLESLQQILAQENIIVGETKVINNPEIINNERELTIIESQPVSFLITKANEDSNNLFAESLLNLLGNETKNQTSLDGLKDSLSQLGIPANFYHLKDGSGLSRHNLVTPEALVRTLRLMSKTSEADNYRNSLAVAGVRGTLQERFKETEIKENLQAKTGTLSGVSALSGYLSPPNYPPLVFSIIVNQSELPPSELRQIIDRIILVLSRIKHC